MDYWGSLISLGENASQSIDCEKITLLISTKQRGRINEVIEVEVGRNCFLVQVDELGLTFHPKQRVVPLQSKAKMTVDRSPKSSSDSSSVPDQYTCSTNMSRSNCNGEDEVARAIFLENLPLVNAISSKLNAGISLREKTSSEAVHSVLNVTSTETIELYIQVDLPMISWTGVVARHTLEQTSQGDRASEVIARMPNQNGELDPVTSLEGCEAHSRRIPIDKVMDREELGFVCLLQKGI
ncbi:hypothetical protein V6N13_052941 [Hibiscus sabdariffa]